MAARTVKVMLVNAESGAPYRIAKLRREHLWEVYQGLWVVEYQWFKAWMKGHAKAKGRGRRTPGDRT